jgi:Phage terminase large subunit (GpA)
MFADHLQRVRDAVAGTYTLSTLSKWVQKNIYLEGELIDLSGKYSFQADIIDNPARVVNVVKCAQIGLSTVSMCHALAALATQRPLNVIYTMPSATDAVKLSTTKMAPLLMGSPELRRLVNPEVNNSELKQLGTNFLFIRGTRSETAALSISADMLVNDEIDRSDPDTLLQFRSRLQASKHRLIRNFSTPTIAGVGISKEAETSRRYRHFATCACCGHRFLPEYYTHMQIPGYSGSLMDITRSNLKDVRWQEAHWACPKCGKDPQLDRSRLEWVVENHLDQHEAATYYVSPATAYGILTPDYIVRSSTEFNTKAEFHNQVLGIEAETSDDQISPSDVAACAYEGDLNSSEVHYMGCDMGHITCTVSIGRMTLDGKLLVVHREEIPLAIFEQRRRELCAKYRVLISVHDAQPETDLVRRITDYDKNAYGAGFVTTKSTDMYTVAQRDADHTTGRMNLRMVKVNRTVALDSIMQMFKDRSLVIHQGPRSEAYNAHYTDMRRQQVFDRNNEITYQWVKSSKGEDHMHFALLYLMLACRLRATAQGGALHRGMSLVRSFRTRH